MLVLVSLCIGFTGQKVWCRESQTSHAKYLTRLHRWLPRRRRKRHPRARTSWTTPQKRGACCVTGRARARSLARSRASWARRRRRQKVRAASLRARAHKSTTERHARSQQGCFFCTSAWLLLVSRFFCVCVCFYECIRTSTRSVPEAQGWRFFIKKCDFGESWKLIQTCKFPNEMR